jgi:hypothetical protein
MDHKGIPRHMITTKMIYARKLFKKKHEKQGEVKFRCQLPPLLRLRQQHGKKIKPPPRMATRASSRIATNSTLNSLDKKRQERLENFISEQLIALETITFENPAPSAPVPPSLSCESRQVASELESTADGEYYLDSSGDDEDEWNHRLSDMWTPPPTPPIEQLVV